MSGRRVSRWGGALKKPAARAARSAAVTAARRESAADELAEFGIAYGRLRSAAAKARRAGNPTPALRKVRTLTADLDAAADALENATRRR